MHRLTAHPGRVVGALAALVVAGGAAIGTGAAFTTSTVNPDNTFSAGILDLANDKDNAAILTAQNLVPGDSATGQVTISNTGNVAGGNWTLAQAITASTPGDDPESSASGELKDVLQLEVKDGASTVYSGPLAGLGSAPLGSIAPGASRTFDFKVTFPASGDFSGADNKYEGSAVTAKYTWSASAGS